LSALHGKEIIHADYDELLGNGGRTRCGIERGRCFFGAIRSFNSVLAAI
jgi:hypothetical protein